MKERLSLGGQRLVARIIRDRCSDDEIERLLADLPRDDQASVRSALAAVARSKFRSRRSTINGSRRGRRG
jgi:hypothetical protein